MDVAYLFYKDGTFSLPMSGYDRELFGAISKCPRTRFDSSSHTFYIENTKAGRPDIKKALGKRAYVMINETTGSVSVRNFLSPAQESSQKTPSPPEGSPQTITSYDPTDTTEWFPPRWMEKLETELRARKYSPNTRIAYVNHNKALCRFSRKPPEDITPNDMQRFIAYLERDKKLSASSMNLAISSFRFFYGAVMRQTVACEHHRPKQDNKVPVVLSKTEVKNMLEAKTNPKHKILLMLVYSAGLRVGETVRLKKEHIDLSRKSIRIVSGKGRKDRYTLLSDSVCRLIKDYYASFNIETWVFPGANKSSHLSVRSAQHICADALHRAGINKGASIHSLRHTFATHLMENGTDIRYIQELLGHNSIRTTERYTHVARRGALRIISPLDSLDEGED